MRALLVLALFTVSACSKWPPIPVDGAKRLSTDARLGFIVTETGQKLFTYVDANASSGTLYVAVYTGEGPDPSLQKVPPRVRFYSVNEATTEAKELPDPQLTPTNGFTLYNTLTPASLLYASVENGEVAWFDGTAWTKLAPLPAELRRADATFVGRSPTEVVAAIPEEVWVLHAGAWQRVLLSQHVSIGPWDSAGLRVTTLLTQTCTSLLDVATVTRGAETCQTTTMRELSRTAFNGTTDDFQLLELGASGSSISWHYANGTWRAGSFLNLAFSRFTPKSTVLVGQTGTELTATNPLNGVGGLVALRDGAIDRVLLSPFTAALTCGCLRDDDATCDCVRRGPVSSLAITPDGATAFLFGVDTADAHRKIFVRKFVLPQADVFDAISCSPACMVPFSCQANTLTTTACLYDQTRLPTERLNDNPAVALTLTGPLGPTTATMSVAFLDGGDASSDVQITTPLPSLTLQGAPHTGLRLTFTQPGYVTRTVEVTLPDLQRTADLGPVFFTRGTLLGEAAWQTNTDPPFSTSLPRSSGLITPVKSEDGGARWVWIDSSDAGLTTAPLADTSLDSARRARVDPKGRYLLLPTATGLALYDVSSRQRLGELPGADWDTNFVDFAVSADVVAVRRGAPTNFGLGETAGSTEVLSFGPSGLTSLWQVSTPGTKARLSGDGQSMTRLESARTVLRTATTNLSLGLLQNPLISGDGQHVLDLPPPSTSFTLLDHLADGGAAVLSGNANFVVADPTGFTWVESPGVVKNLNGIVMSSGLRPLGSGVPRLGVLYVQPQSGTMLTPLLGATEPVPNTAGFAERWSGEAVALTTNEVVLLGAPALHVPVSQGVVFGPSNTLLWKSTEPATLRTVDPQTGFVVPGTSPWVPAGTGLPTPLIDGHFSAAGDPRLDAYFMPCLLYAWPRVNYTVANDGTVTKLDGGFDLACVN